VWSSHYKLAAYYATDKLRWTSQGGESERWWDLMLLSNKYRRSYSGDMIINSGLLFDKYLAIFVYNNIILYAILTLYLWAVGYNVCAKTIFLCVWQASVWLKIRFETHLTCIFCLVHGNFSYFYVHYIIMHSLLSATISILVGKCSLFLCRFKK
jgi:hypothetical protein